MVALPEAHTCLSLFCSASWKVWVWGKMPSTHMSELIFSHEVVTWSFRGESFLDGSGKRKGW